MSVPFALAIYFTIWWVVLFAVLPFGVRNSEEAGIARTAGADRGAPAQPHMGLKVLATTVLSAVIFAGVYALIAYEG